MAELSPAAVMQAYEDCRRTTLRHAHTFYFASRFLPREKRNACYAVYAFCRYIDDLVDVAIADGSVPHEALPGIIEQWRSGLACTYAGEPDHNSPILLAWCDTLHKYHIPHHLPETLIEGVLMDTTIRRFATFDALWEYCYKVASVVGLMTSQIFGYTSENALRYAMDLGIAMQLTNIIRDVKEDAQLGRIYLPLDELQAAGISEDDILNSRNCTAMREFIRIQVLRAERYYCKASRGIPMLHRDSRMTVLLMSTNYRNILNEVKAMNYDVYEKRASTSFMQKLYTIPQSWREVRRMQSIQA